LAVCSDNNGLVDHEDMGGVFTTIDDTGCHIMKMVKVKHSKKRLAYLFLLCYGVIYDQNPVSSLLSRASCLLSWIKCDSFFAKAKSKTVRLYLADNSSIKALLATNRGSKTELPRCTPKLAKNNAISLNKKIYSQSLVSQLVLIYGT